MIKTDPTYTENEVSRILRESEGYSVDQSDKGEGHAESRHELQARGKNRACTTLGDLQMRIVGYDIWERDKPFISKSGAFDGCQIAAITFALNKKAGCTALSLLCRDKCEFVFANIDVSGGNFSMVTYDVALVEPGASGARFYAGPHGVVLPGVLTEIRALAKGIGLKLMKTSMKSLHIRTAFPLTSAPSPQIAAVRWEGVGVQDQILPA